MKSILKCFELVSRLKVKFNKSFLAGIRVCDAFLVDSTSLLSCRIASIFFLYMGILVGTNPDSYLLGIIFYGVRREIVWIFRGSLGLRFEGLGVKVISRFNNIFLDKWMWRRIVDPDVLS
ncbi:hypothetical protein Lal_00025765, partial [Lupinus albus]